MDIHMLTQFLMWCTVFNVALLTISAAICLCASDWLYGIHSKFYSVSRETFSMVCYGFLIGYKIAVLVFNVVPYIALLICGN